LENGGIGRIRKAERSLKKDGHDISKMRAWCLEQEFYAVQNSNGVTDKEERKYGQVL